MAAPITYLSCHGFYIEFLKLVSNLVLIDFEARKCFCLKKVRGLNVKYWIFRRIKEINVSSNSEFLVPRADRYQEGTLVKLQLHERIQKGADFADKAMI